MGKGGVGKEREQRGRVGVCMSVFFFLTTYGY